jgi:tetratricopeptide (TPR) repeat protein
MKIINLIIIIFALTFTTFAQSTADIRKIALSVIMPDNVEGLNDSQLSKLETKITQIVTSSGIATSGYNNNFVIYPKFSIIESNIIEGGIQNITVVTAEINLFIKQVDNNLLFSSISKSLKGSGSSKVLAISNAISKIMSGDQEYKTFIFVGKSKIIQYYESKCTDIRITADSYIKMQQYEKAMGLLMSVPEEISSNESNCYIEIQEKAIEAYKAFQTQSCSVLIQKAITALAANDYAGALNILSDIDPSTSCFNEALKIAEVAEKKVNEEEKQQWDFQMKQYNDAKRLEEQRIQTIKEIAASYYKSQPTSVTYNYVVR